VKAKKTCTTNEYKRQTSNVMATLIMNISIRVGKLLPTVLPE